MHRSKVAVVVAILAVAVLVGVAVGQAPYTFVQALTAGQTMYVSCDGANRLRAERLNELIVTLSCGRPAQQPTATAVPPTATPEPTAMPTMPPDHEHPTETPTAGLAPIEPASLLGTCPVEVHDYFVTPGPDGKLYRTWHPQMVTVNGVTCTFAHEHGDDPRTSLADNSLPAFGYVGALMGMSEAHEGFKVFVTNRGTRNDEGRTAQVDSRIVAHFGTSRQGRVTMPHHSFEYDMISPDGNYAHVSGMAMTDDVGDICQRDARSQSSTPIGRTLYAVPSSTNCAANAPYEIWQLRLSLMKPDGDGAVVLSSVAAFDPATMLDLRTMQVAPTGATGCDREAYHGPIYGYQQGWSSTEWRTDVLGNYDPAGPLVQQVSRFNRIGLPFSNDQTLFKLRSNFCAPGLAYPN